MFNMQELLIAPYYFIQVKLFAIRLTNNKRSPWFRFLKCQTKCSNGVQYFAFIIFTKWYTTNSGNRKFHTHTHIQRWKTEPNQPMRNRFDLNDRNIFYFFFIGIFFFFSFIHKWFDAQTIFQFQSNSLQLFDSHFRIYKRICNQKMNKKKKKDEFKHRV